MRSVDVIPEPSRDARLVKSTEYIAAFDGETASSGECEVHYGHKNANDERKFRKIEVTGRLYNFGKRPIASGVFVLAVPGRERCWVAVDPVGVFMAQADSEIAGRSGTTVSSGTCTIYKLAEGGSGSTREYETIGEDITVFNPLRSELPADRLAFVQIDSASGEWIVLGWDCEE